MPGTIAPDFLVADLAVARGFASTEEVHSLLAEWLTRNGEPFFQRLGRSGLLSAADLDLLGSLVLQHLRMLGRSTDGLGWTPDAETDSTLGVTPVPPASQTPPPVSSPKSAAGYRIVREHAQGGLGQVSVAVDVRLGREVAIKEIRTDKRGREDLKARFLREATIAGQLEHPGIVPVYSFGEHDNGQPFYAMRFVTGETLGDAIQRFHTGNSDFDSLEFRQLLNRFTTVCEAIAYAHAKGVIHRDLKPANIMLGQFGETLVVDWGLAKQLAESVVPSPDAPGLDTTQSFGAIGTASYMSPEQAAGHTAEIGPASDIYSLGATLYHLLTGQAPNSGLPVDIVLAKARSGDFAPPRQVQPAIPKAIEAICLRAMGLQPTDRYQTAKVLGDDVIAWLADAPVAAYVESVTAKVKRWARKHPGTVTGLATTLLVGMLGTGTGLYFVNEEKNQKELARRDAEDRKEANEAMFGFVEDKVFSAARPKGEGGGLGPNVLLKDALRAAAPSIFSDFQEKPLLQARVHMSFGKTFAHAGLFSDAETRFRDALALYTKQLGDSHPDTLDAMNDLSNVLAERGDISGATNLLSAVVKGRTICFGTGDKRTLMSMSNLATTYADSKRYTDALKLDREVLQLCYLHLGANDRLAIQTLINIGDSLIHLDDAKQALEHYEAAFDFGKRILGEKHPTTLYAMKGLGVALTDLGRHDDAFSIKTKALAHRKQIYGDTHPTTLASEASLATTLRHLGRHEESLTIRRRLLEWSRGINGPTHSITLAEQNNLALALEDMNRKDEAMDLRRTAFAAYCTTHGIDRADVVKCGAEYARLLCESDRSQEAQSILDRLIPIAVTNKNVRHEVVWLVISLRVRICSEQKDIDNGRQLVEKWETLGFSESDDLCRSARLRSIVSVLDPTGVDAVRAMTWLQKAVRAGFGDMKILTANKDLDPLRQRDDFKKLLAEIEAAHARKAELKKD